MQIRYLVLSCVHEPLTSMARIRRRQRSRPQTARKAALRAAVDLHFLALLLLSEAEDDDDEMNALIIAHIALEKARLARQMPENGRFGPRGAYDREKATDFIDLLLYRFTDRQFKAWMRMDRESFWLVHDLICDDPVFLSTGIRPQRSPKYQLATFLCRVGAETAIKTAGVMAIAEGSVYLYMERVSRALRNIRHQHLAWPGHLRRQFLSEQMQQWGFPGCLGSGDEVLCTYHPGYCRSSRNLYVLRFRMARIRAG
ncbi:hypothetical protein B0H34DRAFT_70099 [Crassisporium funariophilum]|nr:hypothetical protein B0H34DRAFT_70099 [Crassisporium funariophilum]